MRLYRIVSFSVKLTCDWKWPADELAVVDVQPHGGKGARLDDTGTVDSPHEAASDPEVRSH